MRNSKLFVLSLFGFLTAGCPGGGGDTDSSTGDGSETDAPTGTEPTGTEPTGTDPTDPSGEPTTTDGPIDGSCDPKAQDCPEGSKCTAYGKLPGEAWNANKCVPDVPDGGLYGEPCEIEGDDIFTGIDNCAEGYICLNTTPDGKDGACVEFCSVDDACPNTGAGDGICNISNDGALPICLATCDPLLQDCPGQQGCYGDPMMPFFVCFMPDPKDGGQDGNTCEFTNACLKGLSCAVTATQDGCPADSYGCCTTFCALDAPNCTDPEECVAFFEESTPGFENVGLCVLPG